MSRFKGAKAVAMAAVGLASVGVLLAAVSLYKITQLENNKLPLFVAVDFEQGFYDAHDAGLKINAGEWLSKRVESICSGKECVILNGGAVLGGRMIDVNQEFREAYSIGVSDARPSLSSSDIESALKELQDSLLNE